MRDPARSTLHLSSGDPIADRRYEYAQDLARRGDLAAAADLFAQAAERAPDFASAWYALGDLHDRLGDTKAAIDAFIKARAADADDRSGAGVRLARLGALPAEGAMSRAYVRSVFDQYAPDFDRALTRGLNYRGPELLYAAVAAACQQRGRDFRFQAALDLGCGTGLAGERFRRTVGRIEGVDLSPAMAAQALRRGCYDAVHVADMVEQARTCPDAAFDLVVAADALVYLGDLAPLLAELARIVMSGGLFAFSVETHAGAGVSLGEKLRYAHAPAYIRGALANAGFSLASLQPASTRTEADVPVSGLVVAAVRE